MIKYTKHILPNGLRLVVNEDRHTPMATVAVAYNAGAKFDPEEHTGLAHLFEHLMFSGSKNAKSYDDPLHSAGGDGNAFTNSDITCFHATVPAVNVEIPLFLEADRMAGLRLNQKSLNVQKKVVLEEFEETVFNEPFGDVWHTLLPISYQRHPYRFPVIGKDREGIKSIDLDLANAFYQEYYAPNNAVVSVSGNVDTKAIIDMVDRHFGQMKPSTPVNPTFSLSPEKAIGHSFQHQVAEVPAKAIYMTFQMGARLDKGYYAADLFTDALAYGKSSFLHRKLVKDEKVFTEIDAYLTGTNEPGLLVIEGRLQEGIGHEVGEEAVKGVLGQVMEAGINEHHLQLLKNRAESNLYLSEVGTANKAILLAQYELMGDAGLLNQEAMAYDSLAAEELLESCKTIIGENHVATLWYGG